MGAEGGKAEEGEGMLVKTLAIFTPSLSSGGAIEETGSSAAEVGKLSILVSYCLLV